MHWLWWAFWLIAIAAVVWAVSRGSQVESHRNETPLEVLRRRYAEGEISTEEYEERKRRLQSDA